MSLKDSGNFHYKNRNYTKAIEYYLKSLEANPNEAAVLHNLAMSHFQLQHYEECLASCTKALELEPTYKKVLFRRMHTYAKLGNYLQAILDGHRFLALEDPKDESYADARRDLNDYKAKLVEESSPPDSLKMVNRKRSTLPASFEVIRNALKYDPVGLLYLRECFKKVMDGLQLSLSVQDLTQLEELKMLVCSRLLQLETPENVIDIVDVVLPLQKNRKEKAILLRHKIEAAKKLKAQDIAIAALRELSREEDSKGLLKEIEEFNVPSDDDEEKEKDYFPQEASQKERNISGIQNISQLSTNGPDKITSEKAISLVGSVMLSSNIFEPVADTNGVNQKDIQPNGHNVGGEPAGELEKAVRQKLSRLEKHRSFSDYIDILEKLTQIKNNAFTTEILEEVSRMKHFSMLMAGLSSAAEKEIVQRLIAGVPKELAKRYQV